MSNKLIIFVFCGFFVLLGFFAVINAQNAKAQSGIWETTMENFYTTEGTAGYGNDMARPQGLENLISNIIKIILSFVGGIFLILVIVGGYGWMMSGGNEEKLKASQKRLLNGVLGMLIILTAYILTDFVVKFIIAASGG